MIQLPDFILFLYDRIKKLGCFCNVSQSNMITAMGQNEGEWASATDRVQVDGSRGRQNTLDGRDILNSLSRMTVKLEEVDMRLSKVENDNIKIFKRLDDIAYL